MRRRHGKGAMRTRQKRILLFHVFGGPGSRREERGRKRLELSLGRNLLVIGFRVWIEIGPKLKLFSSWVSGLRLKLELNPKT